MLESGSCLVTEVSFSIAWLVIFIHTGDPTCPLCSWHLAVLLCTCTVAASHLNLYSNMRKPCSVHKSALPRNAVGSEIQELATGERIETLKARQVRTGCCNLDKLKLLPKRTRKTSGHILLIYLECHSSVNWLLCP